MMTMMMEISAGSGGSDDGPWFIEFIAITLNPLHGLLRPARGCRSPAAAASAHLLQSPRWQHRRRSTTTTAPHSDVGSLCRFGSLCCDKFCNICQLSQWGHIGSRFRQFWDVWGLYISVLSIHWFQCVVDLSCTSHSWIPGIKDTPTIYRSSPHKLGRFTPKAAFYHLRSTDTLQNPKTRCRIRNCYFFTRLAGFYNVKYVKEFPKSGSLPH